MIAYSDLITDSVTNMKSMFNGCSKLVSLSLTSFNTEKVTTMASMFYYAGYKATTWNLGNLNSWNTSKVTTMASMFSYAGYNSQSFELDLSNWSTENVTTMSFMFAYYS